MDRAFVEHGAPGVMREYRKPVGILLEREASNARYLLGDAPAQPVLGGEEGCMLRPGGVVLLDFGRELQGGVEITVQEVPDPESARLHLVFGESASEAMSELGRFGSGNHHSVRDVVLPVCFLQRFQFGDTGFRFVRLQAIGSAFSIRAIRAVTQAIRRTAAGRFRCSDPLLNAIWETGLYTVSLCMRDYLWDGVKRDRLVWIGDMHPEVSTICSAYGFDPCVPRSLDLIRDETPANAWMNRIPSYTMWWIIIHRDWYLQNGDYAYLQAQHGYLMEVLRALDSCVRADGVAEIDNDFVDWSSKGTPFARAGMCAVLAMALDAGAQLCEWLAEPGMASRCRKARARLALTAPYDGNKQMAGLVALSGLEDAERINDRYLRINPAEGLSTFLGYYVLRARAKAGDHTGALDVIRGYWGRMLDLGATTFWEDFDTQWGNACPIDRLPRQGEADVHRDFGKHCYTQYRHSLCHGWASAPTAFLSRDIVGLDIAEPGCGALTLSPHLGDLEWAEVSYPTPHGPVDIRCEKSRSGAVEMEVSAPRGVEVRRADTSGGGA